MGSYNITVSTILFTTCIGFLLNLGGFITYSVISPIIFLVGEGLLIAAIALANTPLLKGGAVVLFVSWLFVFLVNIDMPFASPWKEFVYAVLFVPAIIGVGMEMLEAGKG